MTGRATPGCTSNCRGPFSRCSGSIIASRSSTWPGPVAESLRDHARRTYGIELVDVRLRRFNYPPQVRSAIFDRIRSERNKKVAEYQSEGEQLAKNIRSEAEYKARTILADARAE